MAEATTEAFGSIDILINNAAIYDGLVRKPFDEISLDEWDRVMGVNVKGAFLATRAVFPVHEAAGLWENCKPLLRDGLYRISRFCALCGFQGRHSGIDPISGR